MQKPILIKVGGSNLDQEGFVEDLANTILQLDQPVVIVHGGGKTITQVQRKFDIEAQYVDGLRVTDQESLDIVEMVLCGAVNTRLVRTLMLLDVEAQGLNGMDRGFILAHPKHHPTADLGFVGTPAAVRPEVVENLLQQGVTPVIAPICLGPDGPLNVNADHVAGAVGKAIDVERVVFVSNVPGVLNNDHELIPQLTPELVDVLIEDGTIVKGMMVKVRTAQDIATASGHEVMITNLAGLVSGQGTIVTPIPTPNLEEN